jgi:hypothetical protein
MKSTTTNSRQLDILGNDLHSSAQEILTATLKRCRQNLGYFSIFATLPALLFSNIPEARTEGVKPTETSAAGKAARSQERLKAVKTTELLKRQSRFRLPHQNAGLDNIASLGPDDCPGRPLVGGSYTSAAPYIESGDTTGANDTVSSLRSYYYYYYGNYDARGPDNIYSFTLSSRGPNPKIEVSTTSGTYRPLIYVLQGPPSGQCPGGTGNLSSNWVAMFDSRWAGGNTATIDGWQMSNLPLNVPLHLFIDSDLSDSTGAGPYTIRMEDVTIAPTLPPNPIDSPEFFVRQHYVDFLNRQPDPDGLTFWMNQITSCGGDQGCVEVKRINDSGSFFLSIEFQDTGYLAYRTSKAAYGNLPNAPVPITFSELQQDSQQLGQGLVVRQAGWEQVLENNKQGFVANFVQRSRFTSAYPISMTAEAFVDTLFSNAGVAPASSDRQAAIDEFAGATTSADFSARARALRRVAENPTLVQQEFNRAFVLMQYFGYLRRNPNDAPDLNFDGYNFWLNKLNQFNGDFNQAEMVKAFVSSIEYRRRFEL